MSHIIVNHVTVDVSKDFSLRHVDLAIDGGEVLGIIGINGCGKSSLLKAIVGWQPKTSGSIQLNGKNFEQYGPRERARLVGYLPQLADFKWDLRVREAVAIGRIFTAERWYAQPPEDHVALEHAMRETNVWNLRDRFVSSLSGGETMRVHLARLFYGSHEILLADEPCASLDIRHQHRIMQLLRDKAASGTAIAVVLHDPALAQCYCDRLALMHKGTIVFSADPATMMQDPRVTDALGVKFTPFKAGNSTIYLPQYPL